MKRQIQDFKTFEEAEKAERDLSLSRSPRERLELLHKLIRVWMRFPRFSREGKDDIPTLVRFKRNG